LHHVEYSDKSHTYSQTVYVTNNFVSKGGRQTAAPQSAAVILAGYKQPGGLPKAVVIPLLVVLIGAGILFFPRTYLIRSKRLLSRNLAHGKPTDFFLNHGNNLHTT